MRIFYYLLFFIVSFVSVKGQSYSRGLMFDPSTFKVSPNTYLWRNLANQSQWINSTTPTISWNTNEYGGTISADTTFVFGNAPSDTNTVRRLHILLIGDGSHFFTNTTDTIYWQTPVRLPQNGTNEYWFEWNRGVVNGWMEPTPNTYLYRSIGDETTTITTGTAKLTFRMPHAMILTEVRASLSTVSSSGVVTFDVNEGGTSIFSTTLTIDANEKTSTTAATAAVISDTSLADDAEITVDFDGVGTGAKGGKILLIGIAQ